MTPTLPGPFHAPVDQLGIVVEDLDAAVRGWTEGFGVGPWTIFRNVALPGLYRGQPTNVTMDVALGYRDRLQIELIAPTNAAASPYRTDAGDLRLGFHHVAWFVESRDAAVAEWDRRGLSVVFSAETPAVRVSYLEDPRQRGQLFEVIEGAGQREMLEAGIAAARAWDGRDPIQTIIDLGES